MMAADRLSTTLTTAELWVAYLRKILIAFAPVLLAGALVIEHAIDAHQRAYGVDYVTAGMAVAQAAVTYWPGNAIAKAVWSLGALVGASVVADLTDHHLSAGEIVILIAQLLAWVTASTVTNGAHPEVVKAARTVVAPV